MKRALTLLGLAAFGAACHSAAPPAPAAPEPSAPAAAAAAAFPTTPPATGPAPTVVLPTSEVRTLSNGLRVIYVKHGNVPLVHATLIGRGGMADDPARTPGLAAFTAGMLDEGAGGKSSLEIAAALDALGAALDANAGWDNTQVDLEVLRSRLGEALPIMADVVIRPDFPETEVKRIRQQQLTNLARAKDEARVIAGNAFASLIFGAQNPYGRLTTTESVGRIDRAALRAFHRDYYRPGSSTLLLVGDVDANEMQPLVERTFGTWAAGKVTAPAPAPQARAAATPETMITLIDKPGAAQSEVRIGNLAVARNTPDYYPLVVLNTLLGGSFTSRLNMNLRETHGYTYGANSVFSMRRGVGPFMASSAIVTAKTDSAMIEFFKELNRVRSEQVPADELERAKSYVALGFPRGFETMGGVAARLAELETYNLPRDYYADYVQRIMAVTADDVRRVANEYIQPGRATVVIVGDRQAIEPGLRKLNLGAVQVRKVEEFVR